MDNKEDPVFTSNNIKDTKSRSGSTYFTNIQKASLGQKLSARFAKYRRDSEVQQKAQIDAFKARRAKRRQEADLRAMSVNIPIAAENGNPALMNTHYAPRPRAKAHPLTIVGICLAIILLVAGIILTILRPWEPKDTPTRPNYYYSPNLDDEDDEELEEEEPELTIEDIDIDVATAASDEGPTYIRRIFALAGEDLYIYNDDGYLIADQTADHIDQVVSDLDITDPAKLSLFELEKARIYITTGNLEKGFVILESFNESELSDSQLGMYYNAYALYYDAIGENEKAAEIRDKSYALPISDGIGDE